MGALTRHFATGFASARRNAWRAAARAPGADPETVKWVAVTILGRA